MQEINVKAYLDQLRWTLPYVPPIPAQKLKILHQSRDYEGMVRLIKRTMNLEVHLLVGWVNSGGPSEFDNAPAWVQRPDPMPRYGTATFRDITIKMFLRRSFLAESNYAQIAIAIAHELSHVVLDSIQHPLRKEEKAVDLTAMLLGFSRLYQSASFTETRPGFGDVITQTKLGYLTARELRAASQILIPFRWRVLQSAKPFLGVALVALVACWFLAFYGLIHLYSKR
jgi:hypothetical protein